MPFDTICLCCGHSNGLWTLLTPSPVSLSILWLGTLRPEPHSCVHLGFCCISSVGMRHLLHG